MAKKLPLLQRLNNALNISASETDKDRVYNALYLIGKESLDKDFDSFYSSINYNLFLDNLESENLQTNIKNGKNLAAYLKTSINLPQIEGRGKDRSYTRRLFKVMEFEFEKLKEFYE